jgi:hypothetical protein
VQKLRIVAQPLTCQVLCVPRKTAAQLDLEINEELARARANWSRKPAEIDDAQRKKLGLCTYCDKPTRKGSALIDGWCAHKSCIAEYEDR